LDGVLEELDRETRDMFLSVSMLADKLLGAILAATFVVFVLTAISVFSPGFIL
jgi:hypothetical protein